MEVTPFTIEVPDAVLDDLSRRLEATRWPGEIPGSDWDYGTNLGYVQALVDYRRTSIDWRAQEKRLNAFHHYKATVDGLAIHIIHETRQGPHTLPFGITPGCPGALFEMYTLIPHLTVPRTHSVEPA